MKTFPSNTKDSSKPYGYFHGMDLRDYFAAQVMHYWLCSPINNQQIENLCKGAYQVADAMMKAREQ